MPDVTLSESYKLFDCPVPAIYVDDTWNCRGMFTEQSVLDLARQIEYEGRLQSPIQVQPAADVVNGLPLGFDFRAIAGFRRLMAVGTILKWPTVPAFLRTGLSEDEARYVNYIENIGREDLTLPQQARGLVRMYPKGTSVEEICKHLKKPRDWVKARLAYLEMPLAIKSEVDNGTLTQYDVIKISRLPDDNSKLDALLKLRNLKAVQERPGRSVTMKHLEPRRRRSKTEILNKSVDVAARLGEGPWNYVLAWAVGNISDEELDSAIDTWDL
jgi:ParB-like chromosome segregation protein Spo0J